MMLLGVTSWAFAQGTRFLDNEPWAKVVEQAKKADKMIFVDCYTSWCGPCKTLATEIFPQEKVGDYMNERFVCVKYDMEKEEGLKFNELYPGEVKAYPTMLIIDNKGELLHKVVGSQPADDLIRAIDAGLQGNTIYTMIKEYASRMPTRRNATSKWPALTRRNSPSTACSTRNSGPSWGGLP